MLILTTTGGSPDVAYRIARCLQRNYQKFTVYIDSYCKSAGTLLALGAHEVVMSDLGELGPLDAQLYKPDELGEMSSGLTPMQALNTLQTKAFTLFEEHFLQLRVRSGLQITTKSAAEIASNLAIGLFTPIYAQIDPMRLGEIERAVSIASEYGERIGKKNLKDDALERLVAGYPSHEFVIDREEASELFRDVREPSPEEEALVAHVAPFLAKFGDEAPFVYLDDLVKNLLEAVSNEQGGNEQGGEDGDVQQDRHASEGTAQKERSESGPADRADGAQERGEASDQPAIHRPHRSQADE